MKAFLLSAGLGTRLRPLTNDLPKCLLPIGGRPLLFIWLDLLEKEGVDEVLINTYYLPDMITSAINSRKNKINIKIFFEENLLGSGGTILKNKDFIGNDDDFFVLYSDNLTNISLSDIYSYHKSVDSVFTTYVYETNVPEQKGIFVADKQGRVLDFEEKPAYPKSNIANAGLGVLNKKIFYYLKSEDFIDFGKDVMPKLIGKMFIKETKSYIRDIGTLDDYYRAEMDWKVINII